MWCKTFLLCVIAMRYVSATFNIRSLELLALHKDFEIVLVKCLFCAKVICTTQACVCILPHGTVIATAAVFMLTPLLFPQLVASAADYSRHLLSSSYSSLQYHSISLTGIRSSHYHCLHCCSSTLGGAPRLNTLGEGGVKMLPVNAEF